MKVYHDIKWSKYCHNKRFARYAKILKLISCMRYYEANS